VFIEVPYISDEMRQKTLYGNWLNHLINMNKEQIYIIAISSHLS
jgi:hypothetical protein